MNLKTSFQVQEIITRFKQENQGSPSKLVIPVSVSCLSLQAHAAEIFVTGFI